MNDKEIFRHLLEAAKSTNDPEGAVAACLVNDGKILVSSASSDDGIFHAEYLVLQKSRQKNVIIDDKCVLYTTIEPCSDSLNANDGIDCATIIIEAGIKSVVYAADDRNIAKMRKKDLSLWGWAADRLAIPT